MYIGRTILRRISTGAVVDQWPTFVRTRAGVLARLSQAQRDAVQAEPGDYDLDYRLACFYRVRVVGRRRDVGSLVLEYDVWRTKAAADAGDPPDWTNTHTWSGLPKAWSGWTGAEKRAWLRSQIEDEIKKVSFRDATGDERDNRGEKDPLNDAGLAALDGAAVEKVAD